MPRRTGPRYTGWATHIYPDMDEKTIRRAIEHQRAHNVNVLWIAHANPGNVSGDWGEPALCFSVLDTLERGRGTLRTVAKNLVRNQKTALALCREMGLRAVLPIGYQTMMGARWTAEHPEEVRRYADGRILDWGGVQISFYGNAYRRDILRYYRWIEEEFVAPFRDVVIMLNLADEPTEGDYSAPAEKAFRAAEGYGFGEVGEDPARIAALGRFQNGYIPAYAAWSAERWREIDPDVKTTMSFCGAIGRYANLLPNIEKLFYETPETFHPTMDVYPKDGGLCNAAGEHEIVMLQAVLRELGRASRRAKRKLWLWPAGNFWGLGQGREEVKKTQAGDGLANVAYDTLLSTGAGADLEGFALWSYWTRNQGLLAPMDGIQIYDRKNAFDPETFFRNVGSLLPAMREAMGRDQYVPPEAVVLLPPEAGEYAIGAERAATVCHYPTVPIVPRHYNQDTLGAFARDNVAWSVTTELDADLLRKAKLVLLPAAAGAERMHPDACARLLRFVRAGGTLVCGPRPGLRTDPAQPDPKQARRLAGLLPAGGRLWGEVRFRTPRGAKLEGPVAHRAVFDKAAVRALGKKARTLATNEFGDPILVACAVGKGRTVQWAADLSLFLLNGADGGEPAYGSNSSPVPPPNKLAWKRFLESQMRAAGVAFDPNDAFTGHTRAAAYAYHLHHAPKTTAAFRLPVAMEGVHFDRNGRVVARLPKAKRARVELKGGELALWQAT